MDSGALAQCNQNIVKLSYLNDGGTVVVSNSTNTSATSGGHNMNIFPVTIAMVLLSIFGVVLASIIYAKSRYKKRAEKEKAEVTFFAMCDEGDEVSDHAIDTSWTTSSISFGLLDTEWAEFRSSLSQN